MTTVTDKNFKEALENLDNVRIMNKVCSRYRATIPYDEIERCKLIALWQAMEAFDPEGGRKFTSFLYNRIDWECKKQIYQINRVKSRHTFKQDINKVDANADYQVLDITELLNKVEPKYRVTIYQRFFDRMTMQEIADNNGYSRETARRYINKGLKEIKQCLLN